jgi:hypothetical protein
VSFSGRRLLASVLVSLAACGPPVARIHVQPSAIATDGASPGGRAIALHVAPAVRDLRLVGTRELGAQEGPAGMHRVEVEYDVGTPLAGSIRAALAHRVAVATSEDGSCPAEARGVLDVEVATPPYVFVHWTPSWTTELGGGALEIVLRLTLRDCDGAVRWRRNVAGYGSSRGPGKSGLMTASPDGSQFAPGGDALVQDLVRNVDAVLSAQLGREGA